MENRKLLRVGILFGGRSGEHEVSLASAASVIRALDSEKYEAIPIGITKDGRWLVGAAAQKMTEQKMLPELLKTGERVVLPPDPSASALVPLSPGNAQPSIKVDVIFPVLHGTFGEDGTVQGLLDLAGVPYVGAGVLGSAVGMDKDVQKRLFHEAKIPIVDFLSITRHDWETNRGKMLVAIKKKFRFPLFVKPATLGSSVGMTRVNEAAELPAAMDLAASFALKILVERAIRGREIEVAVLGNEDPRASVPGEVIPHREYYDYSAKYLESGSRIEIPAKLSKKQITQFQEYAIRGYKSIECAGMARVDFFLERATKKIYLNEINTIPGFTSISMYPKMWEASGVPYTELITRLIELALEQHAEKSRTKYSIELPAGAGGALEG
jgi:D-alanine-D-alanine ligase